MAVSCFRFKKEKSPLFGEIYRPIAHLLLKHTKTEKWRPVTMIVDTGADYTLLPSWYAPALGIDLKKECQPYSTAGIGGTEKVYLFHKLRVALGEWQRTIPVGFLDRDNVPPLMGRQGLLEVLTVLLANHLVFFSRSFSELQRRPRGAFRELKSPRY